MTEIVTDRVFPTVQRLLETWAMMIVEPLPESLVCFDSAQPLVVSTVCYHGPVSGSFSVIVQEPFMRSLAANLLGDDTATEDKVLIDAAKEVANLLAGNLLTEIYGTDQAFALEAPLVSVSDLASLHGKPLPHLLCVKADECPIALSFTAGA